MATPISIKVATPILKGFKKSGCSFPKANFQKVAMTGFTFHKGQSSFHYLKAICDWRGWHSHISTTLIIPITDALCPGYHRTISEPFGQSQNGIGSIMDSFRHLYHLDHVSTLKEVSVLYLLFQSLLLLHTSPLSCSIKAVLLDAPPIPAGMAKFRWNPQESTGMGLESTGIG